MVIALVGSAEQELSTSHPVSTLISRQYMLLPTPFNLLEFLISPKKTHVLKFKLLLLRYIAPNSQLNTPSLNSFLQ